MSSIKLKRICMTHGVHSDNYCKKCKGVDDKEYNMNKRDNSLAVVYNSKKWKIVRMKALVQDEFLCVHCRKYGIDTIASEVDHIVELSVDITLAYELNNLQSLCHSCHMKKTAEEIKSRLLSK